MLNNIKLIGILFLSILLLTNCKKESKQDDQATGEIAFAAIDADLDKNNIFDIECIDGLIVTHARVNLNDVLYFPAVFEFNGKLYTQSIKLGVGDYEIKEFSLMTGTPEDINSVVVKSTPMFDSYYAQFLTPGFAIGELALIHIDAFIKTEIDVEVLCYIEAAYDGFGFVWFDVTEITVREQCFFGDFCIKDVRQYDGTFGDASLYNLDGVTIDEKAIFMITSYHSLTGADLSWTWLKDSENFDGDYIMDGQNNFIPLCVEYADRDNYDDYFKFELYIYVTSGETHDYVLFHTWEFLNDEMIPAGDDGVVDFVLGNCVADTPDLLLPPWMNLPLGTAFDFTLSNGGFNYGDTYWDVAIGGITSPLYDIQNGTFDGWCADEGTSIGNGPHCMNAMSSLYPELLPQYWLDEVNGDYSKPEVIAAANWLWNQVMDHGAYPNYTTLEMQHALWHLFDNKDIGGNALIMAEAALLHTDYTPLPGGWAAIFFVPCLGDELQMTFFIVDP